MRLEQLGPQVQSVLDQVRTPSLEWVNPPFGENWWQQPMMAQGYKIGLGFSAWSVRDRPPLKPFLDVRRTPPPEGEVAIGRVEDLTIYRSTDPTHEYATLARPDGIGICQAQGRGGNIDVLCDDPAGGTLTVQEYRLPGWRVSLDGAAASLEPGGLLGTVVPPGKHRVSFRYLPWDVPVGLALGGLGAALALACSLVPVFRRLRAGQAGRESPALT
jgi:hypothetical protein